MYVADASRDFAHLSSCKTRAAVAQHQHQHQRGRGVNTTSTTSTTEGVNGSKEEVLTRPRTRRACMSACVASPRPRDSERGRKGHMGGD